LIVEAEGCPFPKCISRIRHHHDSRHDTNVSDDAGDSMAWSMDHVAGPDGDPCSISFTTMEDDEPVPLAIS